MGVAVATTLGSNPARDRRFYALLFNVRVERAVMTVPLMVSQNIDRGVQLLFFLNPSVATSGSWNYYRESNYYLMVVTVPTRTTTT